jgi:hypothetical protein
MPRAVAGNQVGFTQVRWKGCASEGKCRCLSCNVLAPVGPQTSNKARIAPIGGFTTFGRVDDIPSAGQTAATLSGRAAFTQQSLPK